MNTHKHTLYVTTKGTRLLKEGDSVAIALDRRVVSKTALNDISSIVCFTPTYLSPVLAGACLESGVGVTFMSYGGKFLGRLEGASEALAGVRLAQMKAHLNSETSLTIAKTIVKTKLENQRQVLQRAARETEGEISLKLHFAGKNIGAIDPFKKLKVDEVMGCEGEGAARYFGVFGDMIRRDGFEWVGRSRRPPKDAPNALLSFCYALLMSDCLSAAQAVGLDPAFGFLHSFKPGRPALALDLMEHLRPVVADRLVLTLINNRQVGVDDFIAKDGGVLMSETARKTVITAYKARKNKISAPIFYQAAQGMVRYLSKEDSILVLSPTSPLHGDIGSR